MICAIGLAQAVPLPPPRPPELSPPPQAAAQDAAACLKNLLATGAKAEAAATPAGAGEGCVIAAPVRIDSIPGPDGAAIALPQKPLVDCRLAGAFSQWLGGVVAPVFSAQFGARLIAVRTGPGFECRPRNREAGAKLSAHATGLALDVAGFDLADGRFVAIGPQSETAVRLVRTAACGWFTTVLGPGSDAAHENHLHLDVLRRGSGDRYRICE